MNRFATAVLKGTLVRQAITSDARNQSYGSEKLLAAATMSPQIVACGCGGSTLRTELGIVCAATNEVQDRATTGMSVVFIVKEELRVRYLEHDPHKAEKIELLSIPDIYSA